MDMEAVAYMYRHKYKNNDFVIPQEAPIFEPSWQEFEDPMLYIKNIKPIAEQFGICKIRPPPEWQPPFALDIEHFKFTPRVQRLNELEAKTRIKLNFLDQIARFWDLQGCTLKIPIVERKILDLYTIHRIVAEQGGFYEVTKNKLWANISVLMKYVNPKVTSTLLKTHYERILYPYDIFRERELSDKEAKIQLRKLKNNGERVHDGSENDEAGLFDVDIKAALTYQPTSGCKRDMNRLTFYGTGSKMVGQPNRINRPTTLKNPYEKKMSFRKRMCITDPLAKYICKHCYRGDIEESMLLCDGCDDSYHTFCLRPPLPEVPEGDWRCPKCVADEVKKPLEAFGFEQARQEYTLQSFGEMADSFKSDYFNMPVHRVPTTLVEQEFWRLVASLDENVTVEYGADLHSVEHGSGFPTRRSPNLDTDPSLKAYVESGWNLNNIPVLEDSVLSFINADISGMKVPWMYVGMCFSTFCWHNEDHWSYSINYLHWGEPKTWYGVPGSHADPFEDAMKNAAPELFESQPDLLHQLVTILNPNTVMNEGVPVYRTDQQAGEFVITFPRAYHAGFNQGYNFAEAVNFAPIDWLQMGRECIDYYSSLRRYCVFSHDELVCKMAMDADNLNPRTALATYKDTQVMVESEKKLRKNLLEWGVHDAVREAFELLADDARQCETCKTTCFLSAVTCSCNDRLVCLRHYEDLCKCPPKKHVLKYRYSLDEIPVMLEKLKARADAYELWLKQSQIAMKPVFGRRLDLEKFKVIAVEGKEKKYPCLTFVNEMNSIVTEAEQLSKLSSKLLEKKDNPKKCYKKKCMLNFEELKLFFKKINELPCAIPELDDMHDWVLEAEINHNKTKRALLQDTQDLQLITTSWLSTFTVGVRPIELERLRKKLTRASWLTWVNDMLLGSKVYELPLYNKAIREANSMREPRLTKPLCTRLRSKLSTFRQCQERAKEMSERPRSEVTIENLFEMEEEVLKFHISTPFLIGFCHKINNMRYVLSDAEPFLNPKEKVKLADLKDMAKRLENLPVTVPSLAILEKRISDYELWIKETSELFIKESCKISLLEILCPLLDDRLDPKTISKDIVLTTTNILQFMEEINKGTPSNQLLELNKKAMLDQINNLKNIQLINIRKKLNAEKTSEFCICKKSLEGLMYECSLCRDWFHETCVGVIRELLNQSDVYGFDVHFICGFCKKSNRPAIKEIIKRLVKLEGLKLIFPEGEALKLLFERLINVQEKFKEVLSLEEVKLAEKKMNVLKLTDEQIKGGNFFDDDFECGLKWNIYPPPKPAPLVPVIPQGPPPELDHDYTAPPVSDHKKQSRKSPIKHRTFEDDEFDDEFEDERHHIVFSKATVISLKELFNEGGLLELKLNENQICWRYLQASVPHRVNQVFKQEEEVIIEEKKPEVTPSPKRKKNSEPSLTKKPKIPSKDTDTQIKGRKAPSKGKGLRSRKRKGKKTELCAAEKCSKPKGKKIDWVQCDGPCNLWFHMTCVGLEKRHLKKNDDYYCPSCEEKK